MGVDVYTPKLVPDIWLIWWCTSPTDTYFSFKSSFTQSIQLRLRLSLIPSHCTSTLSSTPLPMYYSSLLLTRPYYCGLLSSAFFDTATTFVVPLIVLFLTTILVTPYIHLSVSLLLCEVFPFCVFFTGHVIKFIKNIL